MKDSKKISGNKDNIYSSGSHHVKKREYEMDDGNKLDIATKSDLLESIYKDLNQAQESIVCHNDGPLMVIAGAGTGKTNVVTRRIARLILEGHARPDQILALTFTDKAAKEMEIRLDRLLPMGVVDTSVMTFHSFGQSILRDYYFELGLMPNVKVLSDIQKAIIVKNIMLDSIDSLEYFKVYNTNIVIPRELANFFEKLKDYGFDQKRLSQYVDSMPSSTNGQPISESDLVLSTNKQKYEEALSLYKAYLDYCLIHNYIDYGDMMIMTKKLLEDNPLASKQIRSRYKYIIVDEYQDTNLIQSQIVDLLVNNKNGNIMIVGDDDQSIYSFRSARIENILSFTKSYPDLKQIVLTDNYRNSQSILDLSYSLIQHNNPYRLEYSEKINKKLIARAVKRESSLEEIEPKMYIADDIIEEIGIIADEIKRLVKMGIAHEDIAILTRDKKNYKTIENIFSQRDIPLYINKEINILDQSEIKAVLSSLGAVLQPRDSQRLFAYLLSDMVVVDSKNLIRLSLILSKYHLDLAYYLYQDMSSLRESLLKDFGHYNVGTKEGNEQSTFKSKYDQDMVVILEIEDLISKVNKDYQDSIDLINSLAQEVANISVGQMAYRLITESGYLQRLINAMDSDEEVTIKLQNISRFFRSIHDFEEINIDNTTTIDFWKHIEDIKIIRNEEWVNEYSLDQSSGVQLMTIHKSKGLEFEAVFIPFCNQGVFPKGNKRDLIEIPNYIISPEEHLREERRLMYVAMTRARNYLMISFAQNIGGKSVRKGSIFLQEAFGNFNYSKVDKNTMPKLDNIYFFAGNSKKDNYDFAQTLYIGNSLYLTTHHIIEYLYSPKEFGYWYVLKFMKPRHHHMTVGNAIHAGVEYIYSNVKEGRDYNLSNGIDIISSELRSEDFMSRQHYENEKNKLIDRYKEYFSYSNDIIKNFNIIDIEKSFNWYIKDLDIFIKGRIDMIIEHKENKQISLIDFKSSTFKPELNYNNRQDYKIQLLIYKYAFESLFKKEVANCLIDFVTEPKMVEISGGDFDWLYQKLSIVRQGIDNREFSDPGQSNIDFNRLF